MSNQNPVVQAAINSVIDKSSMASVFHKIVEFNQRVLKIDQRPIGLLNEAETEITVNCLNEEVREFEDAIHEGDLIGAIDALVDNIYFAVGGLYKLGLTPESIEACINEVHNANMEKKLGVNARRGDGQAADAVKPENWVGPEERITEVLDKQVGIE